MTTRKEVEIIHRGKVYRRQIRWLDRFPQIKTAIIHGSVYTIRRERNVKGDETGRYETSGI